MNIYIEFLDKILRLDEHPRLLFIYLNPFETFVHYGI